MGGQVSKVEVFYAHVHMLCSVKSWENCSGFCKFVQRHYDIILSPILKH